MEDGLLSKDYLKDKILVDDYRSFPVELATALNILDKEFALGKPTGAFVNGVIKKSLP